MLPARPKYYNNKQYSTIYQQNISSSKNSFSFKNSSNERNFESESGSEGEEEIDEEEEGEKDTEVDDEKKVQEIYDDSLHHVKRLHANVINAIKINSNDILNFYESNINNQPKK